MSASQTVRLDLPRSVMVDAIAQHLDKTLGDSGITPILRANGLPKIGEQYEGGIYAGLTIFDNTPQKLILLPGEFGAANWQAYLDWCKQQDGVWMSRVDGLLLFDRLKKEFKEEGYWTGEQCLTYPDSAYVQYFNYGNQYWHHKGDGFRGRAVRRLPL